MDLPEARSPDSNLENNNPVEVIDNEKAEDNIPVPIDVDQEYMGADDDNNGKQDANDDNDEFPPDNNDHGVIGIIRN